MFDPNDPRLTAYALGQLSGDEQTEIEAELKLSPELQKQVDEIRSLGAMLRHTIAPSPADGSLREVLAPSPVDGSPASRSPVTAAVEQHLSKEAKIANNKEVAKQLSATPQTDRKIAKWVAMAASILLLVAGSYGVSEYLERQDELAMAPAGSMPNRSMSERRLRGYIDGGKWDEERTMNSAPYVIEPPDVTLRDATYGEKLIVTEGIAGHDLRADRYIELYNPDGFGNGLDVANDGAVDNLNDYVPLDGQGGAEQRGLRADESYQYLEGMQNATKASPADDLRYSPGNNPSRNVRGVGDEGDFSGGVGGGGDRNGPAWRGGGLRPRSSRRTDEGRLTSGKGQGQKDEDDAWRQLGSRRKQYKSVDIRPRSVKSGKTILRDERILEDKIARHPGIVDKKDDQQGKDKDKKVKAKKNRPNNKTWKRSHLIPNTSRLMVGDEAELPISGMQANIEIDGFRARVLLDIYFHNDRNRNLEGNFQIRLPVGASLYFFAFGETSYSYRGKDRPDAQRAFFSVKDDRRFGNSPKEIMAARGDSWRSPKEARMVPREKAAFAYRSTVRRRVDPALVEWAGAGMFNAKIFPITPKKLHRVVIGYDVDLQTVGDELVYRLDVPQELPQLSVDLNVSALAGMNAEVTPPVKPFTSGGRAYYRYDNPQQSSLAVRFSKPGVVLLSDKTDETGPYFATRFNVELPKEPATNGSPIGVFMVDTSASSNPDRMNTHLKLMKATLDGNREQMKQFAVLFFNIEQHWWQQKLVDNTEKNVAALMDYANTMALEGATDLKSALSEAARIKWLVLVGKMRYDLFLLSDGAATWGDRSLFNMAQKLKSGMVGSLFAYQTGMTGTDTRALQYLTRETGGAVITVASEDEIDQAAQSHRFQPWQLAGVDVAGGSDLLLAGRPRTIYPGQQLLLTGRGTPAADAKILLKLRRGDEVKTISIAIDRTINSDLASRAYGQVATGSLENILPLTEDVATAYARHFRITGQSCSLLMLESEADYERFDIKPQDDAFVVKSTAAGTTIDKAFDKAAKLLSDPKAMFSKWLARLEKMPGARFRASAAMKIAVDNLPAEAFEVSAKPLVCRDRSWQGVSDKLRGQLASGKLNYDSVINESSRRTDNGAHADALRGISSLVEMNPGNLSLSRDVAYSALEWDQPGQAFHLLRRVATARPYEPQTLLAMAGALAQMGNNELAVLYYEVALAGKWDNRFGEFHYITSVDYLHLLRKLEQQQYNGPLKAFTDARRDRLAARVKIKQGDLLVTILWNTDGTDVDLHINEPSGEVCFYSHRKTKSGGRMTSDVTQGFGPELYVLRNAPRGKYGIAVKYFSADTNRAGTRTRVYATIYEGWGTKSERVVRKAVLLKTGKQMHQVLTVGIEK